MTSDSERVTGSTSQELARQQEMLNRIEDTIDQTDHTLSLTQRVIDGMTSFGGAIWNLFSSPPERPTEQQQQRRQQQQHLEQQRQQLSQQQQQYQQPRQRPTHPPSQQQDPYIARSPGASSAGSSPRASPAAASSGTVRGTPAAAAAGNRSYNDEDDWTKAFETLSSPGSSNSATAASQRISNSREDALRTALERAQAIHASQDEKLDDVATMMGRLKQQSLIIHDQLVTQGDQLSRIQQKAGQTQARMQDQTRRVANIR